MNALVSSPRSAGAPCPEGAGTDDARFASLLPASAWTSLPAPVRRRFGRRIGPTATVVYTGEVAFTTMTIAGRLFGQLARLVGAPLPLAPSGRVAAAVIVTEDAAVGGQLWTRLYARPGRFAQVIHSEKRFCGPTGLEECVACGVGMRLRLAVRDRALVFRSDGFFVRIAGCVVPLPRWLVPGEVEVTHREERDGRFSFTLTVTHPWLGRIIRQVAFFRDGASSDPPRVPAGVATAGRGVRI